MIYDNRHPLVKKKRVVEKALNDMRYKYQQELLPKINVLEEILDKYNIKNRYYNTYFSNSISNNIVEIGVPYISIRSKDKIFCKQIDVIHSISISHCIETKISCYIDMTNDEDIDISLQDTEIRKLLMDYDMENIISAINDIYIELSIYINHNIQEIMYHINEDMRYCIIP